MLCFARNSQLTNDVQDAVYITATSDLLSYTAFYQQEVRKNPSNESVFLIIIIIIIIMMMMMMIFIVIITIDCIIFLSSPSGCQYISQQSI